jgi:hypothetical protein
LLNKILPRAYAQEHGDAVLVELAHEVPVRTRNKLYYRFLHWPVWIFAFFIAPGPITFEVFANGGGSAAFTWLLVVMAGTGLAGLFGKLPGTEARPYVLLYGEDTPNPLHRRICYTVAWGGIITFAVLNLVALVDAVIGGVWHSRQIYEWGYFPVVGVVWAAGLLGKLPRAKASTQGEGYERRQFYGAVWAVSIAQPVLWFLWKFLPYGRTGDVIKLVVFCGVLAGLGQLARRGYLPRTRPILPGTRGLAD